MVFRFLGTTQLDVETVMMDHSSNHRYCPSRRSGSGRGRQGHQLQLPRMSSQCCSSCQLPPVSFQPETREE